MKIGSVTRMEISNGNNRPVVEDGERSSDHRWHDLFVGNLLDYRPSDRADLYQEEIKRRQPFKKTALSD